MRFTKVLVANRGEIARRIIRTCRQLGFETVAVYSDTDVSAPFVREADEAVHLGPAAASESYLSGEKLIQAALRTGAGAIHPGYGFLSENAEFAEACAEAGVTFVGPSPSVIRVMGSKIEAKALMAAHGVPVVPGYAGENQDPNVLKKEAIKVGFPLLLKASAGGGGRGMRVVREAVELPDAIASASREAAAAFGDGTLLIERYVERPRHIEFQIMGDEHGQVIHCFERECSIQRRHQKIIEETPSAALTPALRAEMAAAAVKAGQALNYVSAGTVEFILAPDASFYFLEVNTRLQVEHPVTEETTGLDLVALQLRVAQGEPLGVDPATLTQVGHSIECRIYAEDPSRSFLPATGTLQLWHLPESPGVRVDSGVETGSVVGIDYDPMLAKVITTGATREEATRKMISTLRRSAILGVTTNRGFLIDLLCHPRWAAASVDTHFIDDEFPPDTRRAHTEPRDERDAILVATALAIQAREAQRTLLPNLPRGYRNNAWRPIEETWEVSGATVEATLLSASGSRLTLGLRGESHGVEVVPLSPHGRYHVTLDGHRQTLSCVTCPDGRVLFQRGGATVELRSVGRFPAPVESVDPMAAAAPMPGKIVRVHIDVGESVCAGQVLVVLEAMKMEHAIKASTSGVVAELFVNEGDLVEADSPILRLQPSATDELPAGSETV